MTQISTIGLDIAKDVFQVHGVNASGHVVCLRRLKRQQSLPRRRPYGVHTFR